MAYLKPDETHFSSTLPPISGASDPKPINMSTFEVAEMALPNSSPVVHRFSTV
jgi:hypothetical protein